MSHWSTKRQQHSLKAVDEEGTKFLIYESQIIDSYHLQTPVSSKHRPSQKGTRPSPTNSPNSVRSSAQVPDSSDVSSRGTSEVKSAMSSNPLEFNMWMFQQNQAAFAAIASGQSPLTSPPVAPHPKPETVKKLETSGPGLNTGLTYSGNEVSESTEFANRNSNGFVFSGAPGAFPPNVPPPGFEVVPLVLPHHPSAPFEKILKQSSSTSISIDHGSIDHYKSSKRRTSINELEISPNARAIKEQQSKRRTDYGSKSSKRQRSSSQSSEDRSSRSMTSRSRSPRKSRNQNSVTPESRSDSRKTRMSRESVSPSRSRSERKAEKSSKKKDKRKDKPKNASSSKKSRSARIVVVEVEDDVGSCCGGIQEYEEELSEVSEDLEDYEISAVNHSKDSASSNDAESIPDHMRYEQTRRQNSSKHRSKYQSKSPVYESERSEKSRRTPNNSSASPAGSHHSSRSHRKRSESPPRDSGSSRWTSRNEDNERLENSLQEFRERKGMSRYRQQPYTLDQKSRFNTSYSSSSPRNSFVSSASSSRDLNGGTSSSVHVNKANDDEDDKSPLAGDDVSPMDRARIENYLKMCQQRYSYQSCGQIPFFDSHCHIDFLFKKTAYKKTYKEFRSRVPFPENYGGCVAVFCEPHAFNERFSIIEKVLAEDSLVACFGCHPHSSNMYNPALENNIRRMMSHPKVRAWGECGLDYSDRSRGVDKEIQQYVFRRQLKCAVELNKPLCVHSRQSDIDLFRILKEEVPRDWKIHRHCYTEAPEMALQMLDYFPNMYIGFTNVLTYNNAVDAIKTATLVPLDRILLETDAPYFLPAGAPKSLKNSNPGMAIQVAERLSHLKSVPIEEVLKKTRQNLKEMYGL